MPAIPAIDSAEKQRLETLYEYEILDTEENLQFDNLAKLAAQICEVPIAKINFIDEERTWSKANYGNDLKESPREFHFCNTTITKDEFMVVEDASKDDRFNSFDVVVSDPKVRFYAGVNIKRNQQNLGTICVLGQNPKQLSEAQLSALKTLAKEVEARLELNKKNSDLEMTTTFLGASVDLMLVVEPHSLQVEKVNRSNTDFLKNVSDEYFLQPLDELFPQWAYSSDLKEWLKTDQKVFEKESILQHQNETIYLELNAVRKEDKLLISAKNITRRKKAEQEVENEKIFTEKIINALPLNFFMYDEDGKLIKWTENHFNNGYSDEEYKKMSPLDFFEGEDKDRMEEYLQKTFAEEVSQGGIEADLVQRGGEKVPTLFNTVCFIKDGKKYLIGTTQSIERQRKYQENLEGLISEKEVLLSEVHHRVKNNLAVISGFLQMQEFLIEDEKVKSVLLANLLRVKSMALIHEDLYKVTDFNGIQFGEYLKNLLSIIQEKRKLADKEIVLSSDVDSFEMNMNQAVPLALIINELVSNAYIYAFEGKSRGKINVSLKKTGDEIHLLITDDGIGLPDGFKLDESPTLGTTLVLSYSEQVNSEIDITSEPGEGTKYELIFNHKRNLKGSSAREYVGNQ
jgi:PAS domain S-box-containing protein